MSKLQEGMLTFLYETIPGRFVLKGLVKPGISKFAGTLLDCKWSTILIRPFIKSNEIDMSEYEKKQYCSYNDFFCRKILADKRPIATEENQLISPCDSSALVLPLTRDGVFHIKRSQYNLKRLLRSEKLAKRYEGGTAVVLRLDVTDYHRYCYIDDGYVSSTRRIDGKFHTVKPIASDYVPVYHENTREYCMLRSVNFKDVIVMEVGALLVGRIVNEETHRKVMRGQEKGHFEFGGSTIILLFQKDAVSWREDLLKQSQAGLETPVKMGEVIGTQKIRR